MTLNYFDLLPTAVGFDNWFSSYPPTGLTIVGTNPLNTNDGDTSGAWWDTDRDGGIYIAFEALPTKYTLDSTVNYLTPIITIKFVGSVSTPTGYFVPYRSGSYFYSQSASWGSFPTGTVDAYVDSMPSNGGILYTDPLVINNGLGPSSAYAYQPAGSNYVTTQDVLNGAVRFVIQDTYFGGAQFRITQARLRVGVLPYSTEIPPLRLTNRDDGLGKHPSPRIITTNTRNRPTSLQQGVKRVGVRNTWW